MNANRLVILEQDESLFVESFSAYSWVDLLAYFQNRTHVQHFPLSKGIEKNVTKADRILTNEFDFNNEVYKLGRSFDWRINPSKDLEWLILLHKFYYFKDLSGAYDYSQDERYAEKWMSLIEDWITQVPDGFIDSQVTGRRLQQWVLSYHTFVTKWHSRAVTPIFFERFISSINSQTLYLCEHLTPEGNHRTLELYAIFLVAVTFPELKLARWFLDFSVQKLMENMCQDLLLDGVHCELSTDYHHTVLKNYLRFRGLASLNQIELPEACDVLLKQAIEFSYYVHKPDGFIPAINDGDCNNYLPLLKKARSYYPDEHLRFVITQGKEGLPPVHRSRCFTESGYTILRSDWATKPYTDALYLFFDCASLGVGSHGHYDALNFEMAAYGYSLVVDPGRYTYSEFSKDGINWRKYFKETAAHNTVVVDGLSQMPYRCERPKTKEPETTLKQFVTASGFDFIHGQVSSHQYPVVHQRMVFFLQPEYWIVTDVLNTESDHNYDLYFHLSDRAQDQTNLLTNETCQIVSSPNLLIAQACSADTKVAIEQGFVSTEYGVKHQAPIIKFSKQQVATTTFTTVLYPFKEAQPGLEVTEVPVFKNGRLCAKTEASVIRINLKIENTSYEDYLYISHGIISERYDFADISCSGRLLFLRRNEAGQIVNLQGEEIGYIKVNRIDILNNLNELTKVSYKGETLGLTDSLGRKGITLFGLDVFPNSFYLSKLWSHL